MSLLPCYWFCLQKCLNEKCFHPPLKITKNAPQSPIHPRASRCLSRPWTPAEAKRWALSHTVPPTQEGTPPHTHTHITPSLYAPACTAQPRRSEVVDIWLSDSLYSCHFLRVHPWTVLCLSSDSNTTYPAPADLHAWSSAQISDFGSVQHLRTQRKRWWHLREITEFYDLWYLFIWLS